MKTARTTIRLLREFKVESPELGVSDLARRLDLDKATVHRLLRSLLADGIIEQNPATKRYRLGLAILDLAAARLQSLDFIAAAVPEIRALRDQTDETVALHVPDQTDVVCVEFIESPQRVSVSFFLGERSPLHVVSAGLVCLAELERVQRDRVARAAIAAYPDFPRAIDADFHAGLDRVRKQGFATADETYQAGIRGIAVPVRDAAGQVMCTLSIVAPTQRKSLQALRKLLPDMHAVARRISAKVMGRREALTSNWTTSLPRS
jgi:DNA-binding IclR family transcriptional regulator